MSAGLLVKWTVSGVQISGSLDDRVSRDDLAQLIPADRLRGPFAIDVEGIKRGNSVGMLEWERFAKSLKVPHYYKNVQFWLVNYFNVISNFFENEEVAVHSFFAPFICEADESSENILLVVGKNLPLMEKYDKFTFEDLKIGNKTFVPDFDPSRYFNFLTRNREKFDQFLSRYPVA